LTLFRNGQFAVFPEQPSWAGTESGHS